MRVADVDLASGAVGERLSDVVGPVDLAVCETDALVLGCGPLSRLEVPGSHRLVVSGASPLWNGLGISTIGSAALSLHALGLQAVVLHERAKSPHVLILDRSASGALRAHTEPIDCEAVWRDGGAYGMLRAAAALANRPSRVLATGPAARTTTFGAIGSASAGSDVFDTWAGRAGFGTQLL